MKADASNRKPKVLKCFVHVTSFLRLGERGEEKQPGRGAEREQTTSRAAAAANAKLRSTRATKIESRVCSGASCAELQVTDFNTTSPKLLQTTGKSAFTLYAYSPKKPLTTLGTVDRYDLNWLRGNATNFSSAVSRGLLLRDLRCLQLSTRSCCNLF